MMGSQPQCHIILNDAVLCGHATNQICYISTCIRPMDIKHSKLTTFFCIKIEYNLHTNKKDYKIYMHMYIHICIHTHIYTYT